jgi:hypothetical protein
MKLKKASPLPPQFVPKLLSILLTVLVLGVVWTIIYHQIIGTMKEAPQTPSPETDTTSLRPHIAAPSLPGPAQPDVPHTTPPAEDTVPVRVRETPQQLTLPEEAHEHRGLELSCKVELKRLCADVQPGEGRLKRCYRERENQLPPSCQQQVEDQAALQRVAQQRITVLCAPDVQKLCANVKVGGGRIQQCLEDHYQDLSPDCYHAVEARLTMN